jgi:alcohol dehydrogenase YqhD (iron-dependent ADH family)
MKYVMDEGIDIFNQYAKRIWNIDDTNLTDKEVALKGIEKTKEFFNSIGAPTKLSQVNIGEEKLEQMAEKTVRFRPVGSYKKLHKNDVYEILKMSL